jgi:hypothetical protein
MKKSVSAQFTDTAGNVNAIEILGKGQQLVAYGIHPDTQEEYRWPKACPFTIGVSDLPSINLEQISLLFKEFDHIAPSNWQRKSTISEPSTANAANDNVLSIEHMRPPTGLSAKDLAKHLAKMDAEPYDEWLLVGQALHHEFQASQAGLDQWIKWSENAFSYDGDEALERRWESFSTLRDDAVVTMRTVIATAKLRGKDALQEQAE